MLIEGVTYLGNSSNIFIPRLFIKTKVFVQSMSDIVTVKSESEFVLM
jgi:hypothetical protein